MIGFYMLQYWFLAFLPSEPKKPAKESHGKN